MFEKETIGKNLNRIRASRHMTIEQLAENTNFTPRAVCNHIKNGIGNVDNILIYCEALGCEPTEMFAPEITTDIRECTKIHQTDIEYMDLTSRSYNALRRAGYFFVEDLEGKTSEDLMKIRNLGRKSVFEIILKANDFGVYIPLIEE